MATYKVPQDVEAEDKLLGPFSFRQFIYLIVAFLAGALAFFLAKVFIGLVILPLPVVLFFLVLALPLKKDQPMETYLTAVVRFWMKPRLRMWDPEGTISLVEISAPRYEESHLIKNFSGNEASERLSYLASVVDTHGWSTRGLTSAMDTSHLSDTLVAEAQNAEDMFDSNTGVAQNLDTMIDRSATAQKQAMVANIQASLHPTPVTPPSVSQQTPTTGQTTSSIQSMTPDMYPATQAPYDDELTNKISFNPYPSSIHQKVIEPSGQPAVASDTKPTTPQTISSPETITPKQQAQAPSEKPVSPDIIRLASNKDLSISTIASEAKRIRDRQEGEEVIISLR